MVLTHNNSSVYFITEKCRAVLLHNIGIYGITPIQGCYCCVKQDDLVNYYPLADDLEDQWLGTMPSPCMLRAPI